LRFVTVQKYIGEEFFWALGFLGFGIWLFFWGFTRFRRQRLIGNIPTSTVRGMALGLVEVIGQVRKLELLSSPLTGTACAFYKYLVERYETHGKSSKWVTVARGDSCSEYFFLDDGTGIVPVYPRGAELMLLSADYRSENGLFVALTGAETRFLESKDIQTRTIFGKYKFRFSEWYFLPGQVLYVLGSAQKVPAESEIWNWGERKPLFFQEWDKLRYKDSDPADDVVISKGQDNECFIISEKEQETLENELSWQAAVLISGGAVLAIAGFLSLFLQLGLIKMG